MRNTTITSRLAPLILAICALASGLRADEGGTGTTILGDPFPFTTWTVAGSPYRVEADITVNLLTIEPGVCVLVDDDVRIDVQSLTAQGTAAAPIVFAPSTPETSPSWHGLHFNNATSPTLLEHCRFEGASMAALTLVDSSPTVRSCEFLGNTRSGIGGAMVIDVGNADVELEGCRFTGNTATSRGGALFADMDGGHTLRLVDCAFAENSANPGGFNLVAWAGAIDFRPTDGHLELERCIFRENLALGDMASWNQDTRSYGGALFATGGSVSVTACSFRGNLARAIDDQIGGGETNHGYGGAIYFDAGTEALTVTNSIFVGNSSYTGGTSPIGRGSAIYAPTGTVAIENSTFMDQTSEALWCGGSGTILNSILFFNNAGGYNGGLQTAGAGALTVDYSDIQGGHAGVGNIDLDPVRNLACEGALAVNSPCVDAGHPDVAYDDLCFPPSVSWFGVGGARNDMGAFGGPGACAWADVSSWATIGSGLAGTGGVTPVLAGAGLLHDQSPTFLRVTYGLATSQAFLVLGMSAVSAPFKGGTLVPSADIIMPVPLDTDGSLPLFLDWVPGIPAGSEFWMQVWIQDPGAVLGLSATNGIRATAR